MRWPLRNQIFVPFGALMLCVLILVSAINAYLAAGRTTDQIAQQIEQIAHAMQTSNYPLNDSILAQTRALSGADFIVTDEAGRVSASTVETPAEFLPPPSLPSVKPGLPNTLAVAGQRYFHSVVRTERGQQRTPQRLHILYPERVWREARWQATYPPLLIGGLALVVVFALSITLASRLSRPILQLQQQVSQLVQGRFEPLPLPRRDDEIRGLIAAVNSLVADLVLYSQAIQRSERLALMGQLSGGLAHHLRNAVAGAKLALQLHQRSCREVDQESLSVAQRQLRLTEEQLQRFLTVGQPQPPQRVVCRLPHVVDEVVGLVGPICQHHKVALQTERPEEPLADVAADPALLHQALLNLVLNAIEAAGAGGWVRIACRPLASTQLAIRVDDSGPGPPAELRGRLFEPFATGKPEGIGLGLAAAKQIAEAHGGTLAWTGNRPTCFELTLPTVAAEMQSRDATSK